MAQLYCELKSAVDSENPADIARIICTPERMKECVEVILSADSSKQRSLVELCKKLATFSVEWQNPDGKQEQTTFKQQLVTYLQTVLEHNKKNDEQELAMIEAIEAADTAEEKSRLEKECQSFVTRARQTLLHRIKFIMQLYLVGMVPEVIVHECVVRLLRSTSDEVSLECFVGVISAVGKRLDQSRIDVYFKRVEDIIKRKRISQEMQSMLGKVLQLRENDWVPIPIQTDNESRVNCLPWIRPHLAMAQMSPAQKETAIVFGKFQSILNKLTPQKFQKLAEKALQLEINTPEQLRGCIGLIFKRIICPQEHIYLIAYANLCKVLSPLKTEYKEDGRCFETNFRRELLTKLQIDFEQDKKDDKCYKELVEGIEKAITVEDKKQLQDQLEEFISKAHQRSLANIRFIGNLFKLSMLSDTIVHEIIVRLLKSTSDSHSLECFAALISVIGSDLDVPKAKQRIDGYFSRIADIVKKGKLPLKTKFRLQDVQDLRKNKWVPRKSQQSILKTIDQIHAEAKAEEQLEVSRPQLRPKRMVS